MAAKFSKTLSHAEIKAGVFITFSIALLIAMLFSVGSLGRGWNGRETVEVLFTQAGGLPLGAPVRYNGLDVGKVEAITIVRVTPEMAARLPRISWDDINSLPLDADERAQLHSASENDLAAKTRKLLLGKTMIMLQLNVQGEHDANRFHEDDEYRILGTMSGECFVSIHTGMGTPLAAGTKHLFVGVAGDMYTDLANSVVQVKDILTSMSDLAGGDAGKLALRGQLGNFEQMTIHYDTLSKSLETRLPKAWDSIDKRIDNIRAATLDVQNNIGKNAPKLTEAFTAAQTRIADLRKKAAEVLGEGQQEIESAHRSALDSIKKWRSSVASYKDTFPGQVRSGREWSERFIPTVEKLDLFLARADEQLNNEIEGTRESLAGMNTQAMNLNEMSFRLARWPWSFAHKPAGDAADAQHWLWKEDVARRGLGELRGELQKTRDAGRAASAERFQRIDAALREVDASLEASPGNAGGKR